MLKENVTARAKFRVTDIYDVMDSGFSVMMEPVELSSSTDDEVFKDTQAGRLELHGLSVNIKLGFPVGQEYYIDLTPCVPTGDQQS